MGRVHWPQPYNIHMRVAVLLGLAALLAIGGQLGVAAASDLELAFISGEVTGSTPGKGAASVTARVENTGSRDLLGLRIGVYYSAVNEIPDDDAQWRPHEFVFEPPLKPGKSTTLRFVDENAAEYIMLRVERVQCETGISFNGKVAQLEYGLEERDGVTYIATRDLMNLIGGGISYDAESYMVVLERKGVEVRFKESESRVLLDGQRTSIEHPVLEIDGRSFLPLADFASLLGVSVSRDSAMNLIVLSE